MSRYGGRLSKALYVIKIMNKPKCLACNSVIPWWQKLSVNMYHGLECMHCHSIMKHSILSNIVGIIMLLAFVISIGKFSETLSYIYFVSSITILVIMLYISYSAKLKLIYKCNIKFKNV